MNVTIKMKDGIIREFKHQGRPGGSYTKTIRYEPGFVVIVDEWNKETAIPSIEIAEIKTEPENGW